jgi:hypothetical protein
MIPLLPDDFGTVEQFPLAWRWTDPRWNVLPPEKLARVRPLVKTKAKEVCDHGRRFVDGFRLRRDLFSVTADFDDCGNNSPGPASTWLKAQSVEEDPAVFVCWGGDQAVFTAWSVFCEFWDDFCYPQECVLIWPESEEWVLLYHPEERICFARVATAGE